MIQIKLDIPALNALFPEGTEARAQLQKSCMENFAHAHLRNIGAEGERMIEQARATTLRAIEEKYLAPKGNAWNAPRVLNDKLREQIGDLAEKEIVSRMRETIDKAVENALETIDMKARVERLIATRMDQYADKCAAELIRERFNKAMSTIQAA